MAKLTQVEKAIANLKAERAVLDMAIQKLEAQSAAKPRKPKAKAEKDEAAPLLAGRENA